MNINNTQNHGYWFVLRDDFNNSFTIHNPQSHEARYVVDTTAAAGDGQFAPINECAPPAAPAQQVDTEARQPDDSTCFWDRSKIRLLLTLCLENNFKNSTKDKGLLEEIAAHLGTSPEDCVNKYKNLRRTFIRLLKKRRQGKEIKWVHYTICEKVFSECKSLPSSVLEPWDDYKVRNLLNIYIENLSQFRSPDCLHKDIWKDIASQMGTSEYNCYHKFKNLKRAYFNSLQRSRDTGKPTKWPYHQYFVRIFYNYSPYAGAWTKTKTRQLMDTYLQMINKFRDPQYQKKDLWKEISVVVGESPNSCDKKFRNLKHTYIKLKTRADSGRSITKWRYFKDFETIYSLHGGAATGTSQGEDYIKQLLQFYLENQDKFRDRRNKKKHVWRLLGSKIGLSSEGCDRKFRNLKQTYIRLADKRKQTGKEIKWPYFAYFEKIFSDPKMCTNRSSYENNIQHIITMPEVRRAVQQLQEQKSNDNFERLMSAVKESNIIQRERNKILQALLDSNQKNIKLQ